MSGRFRGIVFNAELDAKISKIAKEMGVNHSAAVRMLCQRALGQGMARLLVDEKVFEVKSLLAKRINQVVNEGLRQELHALVDEVNPPNVGPLVEASPEVEEVAEDDVPEPTVEAVRGRPRKAAKARRR